MPPLSHEGLIFRKSEPERALKNTAGCILLFHVRISKRSFSYKKSVFSAGIIFASFINNSYTSFLCKTPVFEYQCINVSMHTHVSMEDASYALLPIRN